jgi:hypothetical protein
VVAAKLTLQMKVIVSSIRGHTAIPQNSVFASTRNKQRILSDAIQVTERRRLPVRQRDSIDRLPDAYSPRPRGVPEIMVALEPKSDC